MSVVHRPGQGLNEPRRSLGRLRFAGDEPVQASPVHTFESQIRPALRLADLVDLDDVRVLQLGYNFSLTPKSGQFKLPRQQPGPDHLERYDAIELELAGLVHDAHPAAAQFAQKLEARHRLTS